MSPLYDVKEVAAVLAVSCDEKVLLSKDVFADDGLGLGRREGAMSTVGILNESSALRDGLIACSPLEVFVNFDGVP